MMENVGYGQQKRLKDIVEKEAEEEKQPAAAKEEEDAREQQQALTAKDDDGRYDTVVKTKLVREGKRVTEFRVTGNLNNANTRMIMANITPHIEMRVKVIYSLKSVIY